MKEKILRQIRALDTEIADHQKRLDAAVAEFKEAASKYDAYDIVTFIPGKIRDIEYERSKIAALDEQRRMLVWMCKEE